MIEEMSGDFLQWLRGFYFVAINNSFSHAALEMGRNQPTISHQVKCLEKQFGITLIDRSGRKIVLTPEGRVFLQMAISVFEQINEMREYSSKAQNEGQIRIASTQGVIRFFLPHHVYEFTKRYPKVTFSLMGGDRDYILTKVESAEADFGILYEDLAPKDFVYHDLFQTKSVLAASKKSPYLAEEFSTLNQIAKHPFVGLPKTSTQTPWISRRFSQKGLRLNVVMVVNNFETVKRYVGIGIGVSILEDYTLTQEDKDKFNIFPLTQFLGTRRVGIVMRKKRYLSPTVKLFLKTIKPDIPIN